MVQIKTNLANKSNYGSKRASSLIKYIVIHYTGNDGDSDESNGKYFHNNVVKASAHYFVDDDSITLSVPEEYAAWSVGGSRYGDYLKTGGARLYGSVTNANSINIELCDSTKNGVIKPNKATIDNALELTQYLMNKYGIPQANVVRHFDVNGKHCPAYWMNNSDWISEFWGRLTEQRKTIDVSSYPTLKKGNKGNYVVILQTYLNALGFNSGTIDGDFGSNTLKAVKAFQSAKKLTADGIVGKKTWNALLN